MFAKFMRRASLLLTVTAVGVLGITTAASASPAGPDVGAPTVAVARVGKMVAQPDSGPLVFDVTFDRFLTDNMYRAARRGQAAFATVCAVLVPPGLLKAACTYIVRRGLYRQILQLGPPNGRCLNMSPRIGIPPYRFSYVTCP
jgi:hypothetical protein